MHLYKHTHAQINLLTSICKVWCLVNSYMLMHTSIYRQYKHIYSYIIHAIHTHTQIIYTQATLRPHHIHSTHTTYPPPTLPTLHPHHSQITSTPHPLPKTLHTVNSTHTTYTPHTPPKLHIHSTHTQPKSPTLHPHPKFHTHIHKHNHT